MPIDLEALIFGENEEEPWLFARTLRALERLGVDATTDPKPRGAKWLIRAGAVPISAPRRPLASATGKPVAFVGATRGEPSWRGRRLDSLFLEESDRFSGDIPDGIRVVHWPSLDVAYDARLSIIEVITSLHRGGAERIALDLLEELRFTGHQVALALMGPSNRSTFPEPESTIQLHQHAASRASRVNLLADLGITNGADLFHVHLLDGDEVRLLARSGIPVAVTVHNSRPGWPANTKENLDYASLVVACALDVADELFATSAPVRTIWNGIHARKPLPHVPSAKRRLLTIANHRPQKRLERIPPIVAALDRSQATIVGEALKNDSTIATTVLEEALKLQVQVEIVGSKADVAPSLAEADVVLSTSDFEGLSLVHLEAMAARVPLVTTAVSGTREIAAKHSGVSIVLSPTAEAFADCILHATTKPEGLAPDFTVPKMTERHADLFRQALRVSAAERRGLVILTNNLSVGGAQSSARRLLLALHGRQMPVAAAVIEEQADHPTAGRAALVRAGIDVHVAQRGADELLVAKDLASFVRRRSPEAVLFWNLSPVQKILVADLLLDVPVWDVSPGEMTFRSLDRYFQNPRIGLPYLRSRDYGRLLAGAVVKYQGEKARMDEALGVRVHVIPNGVVIPPARARRESGGKIIIGTLARIAPDKKLEELFASAECLENVEVRIAGPIENATYAAELRVLAAGSPIAFVGERDAGEFLSEIDLFAMISEPGGCPNALLEAMAAGLPIVATTHGGAHDMLGDAGILVARGDSVAMGAALAELAADPTRAAELGMAARARAQRCFDVETMATAYAKLCAPKTSELTEKSLRS